jgi:hypothetical protein
MDQHGYTYSLMLMGMLFCFYIIVAFHQINQTQIVDFGSYHWHYHRVGRVHGQFYISPGVVHYRPVIFVIYFISYPALQQLIFLRGNQKYKWCISLQR